MDRIRGPLAAVAVAAVLVLSAPVAWAGHGGHGWSRHHHHGGHGYWGGGYRHWYGGWGHGYGHHGHGGGDDEVAYLVGGLLLGGILTHAYHTSPARYAVPTTTYVTQPYVYVPPRTERRLVRDAAGNCFESHFDASGAEIRVPIARSECAW